MAPTTTQETQYSLNADFVRFTLAVLSIAIASGMSEWDDWAGMFMALGMLAFVALHSVVGSGGIGRAASRSLGFALWASLTSGVSVVIWRSRRYDQGEDAVLSVIGASALFGSIAVILGIVGSLIAQTVRSNVMRIPKKFTIGLVQDAQFRSQMRVASWSTLIGSATLLAFLPRLSSRCIVQSKTLMDFYDNARRAETLADFEGAVKLISILVVLGGGIAVALIAVQARRRLLRLENGRECAAAAG